MLFEIRGLSYKKRTVAPTGCAGGSDFKGRKQDLIIGKQQARMARDLRAVCGEPARVVRVVRACRSCGFIPR